MEKTSKNKLEDVTRLLALQKIRDVKDLESYQAVGMPSAFCRY